MKRILGFTVLSITTAMACAYHWRLQTMPYTLEISGVSSTSSIAQVFYDAGNGYREEDSVKKPVYKSTTLETLRFPLSARRINALRFDPLAGMVGEVLLRKITAVVFAEGDDPPGDLALVEPVGSPLGNLAIAPGQVGIGEQLADPRCLAAGQVRSCRIGPFAEVVGGRGPAGADNLGDAEAFLGVADRVGH